MLEGDSNSIVNQFNQLFFWNWNHIVHIDKRIVYDFNKIYTLFHFMCLDLNERRFTTF